ncbi:MAG: alpha/beta fold hydrolase [Sphingomonas sp.]
MAIAGKWITLWRMDAATLPPPSKLLLAAELPRALWTLVQSVGALGALGAAPRGDGRAVMVLPCVAMPDASAAPLARYLQGLGYAAEGWGLGINRGTRTTGAEAERLIARIEDYAARHGQPVTLIGISLGGIMARLVAHRRPDLVSAVITICSPYAGDAYSTNAWRVYQLLSGERVDSAAVRARLAEVRRPLPVPACAMWSRSDGMVNGLACRVPGEPGLTIVEIRGGHLMIHRRAAVWRAVAEQLAGS